MPTVLPPTFVTRAKGVICQRIASTVADSARWMPQGEAIRRHICYRAALDLGILTSSFWKLRSWRKFGAFCCCIDFALCGVRRPAMRRAQSFGIELHNTLMPASGGMGGTSIAAPQDLLSSINGNPAIAVAVRRHAVHFWRRMGRCQHSLHSGRNAAGQQCDAILGHVGNTRLRAGQHRCDDELRRLGPAGDLGIGTHFQRRRGSRIPRHSRKQRHFERDSQPAIHHRLERAADRRLGGRSDIFGRRSISSTRRTQVWAPWCPPYGAGGAVRQYQLTSATSLGMYYQTVEQFRFEDAIRISLPGNTYSAAFDVNMGMPDNIGLGVANRSLMDGQLLLAADLLFKQWDNANLFQSIYHNQWIVQTGRAVQSWSVPLSLRLCVCRKPRSPRSPT